MAKSIDDFDKPARETIISYEGKDIPFFDLQRKANYLEGESANIEEHIVKIDWQKAMPRSNAISEYGFFGNQNTVCRPKAEKWDFTVKRLMNAWGIKPPAA